MKNKIRFSLFVITVFFILVPYMPNILTAIFQGIPVMGSISYSPPIPQLPLFFGYFNIFKDIFVVIYIFYSFVVMKKLSRNQVNILFFIILTITIGIVSLLINNHSSMLMIFAGLRGILYLIFAIISYDLIKENHKKILRFIFLLSYLQLIICFLQAYIVKQYYGKFSIVEHRLTGLFEGAGNLGTFAVCLSIILFNLSIDVKKINYNILFLNSLLLSLFSGSRVCIVLVTVIIISKIIMIIFNFLKNSFYIKLIWMMTTPLILLATLNIANKFANRGNAISGNFEKGRFTYIVDHLQNSDLFTILFGYGIGYGTNTAYSLMKNASSSENIRSIIVDGSFNMIISQFGIVTLAFVLIFLTMYLYQGILKANDKLVYFLGCLMFLIITFIGNSFENYYFFIFLIIFIQQNYQLKIKTYKGNFVNEIN